MDKQGVLMNLGNESDDEESVSSHLIEIKLTSITIQISFIQLYKYSQLFRDKYLTEESRESLSEEILQFQNQFDIKEENIILFFKLIQDENVTIINDNYRDLRKLSDYFKVQKLRKFLDKYSKNYLTDLDSIIIQILNSPLLKDPTMGYNDTVNAELEDKLCDKINDCFQNSFFAKLPISIIYRILSKSKIENISSDLLFDFINASVEERYVLFHFLNIGKLNDGKFDMLYKKYQIEFKSKFIYQNIPVDLCYIKSMKDENTSLKKYIENLEKQVKKLINEKEINNTNHQIEISKLSAEKNQILNNTIQLKKEIKNLVDEKEKNNANHQIEISKIRDENIQLKKEIKEIETDNKKYQTKIDEANKRGIAFLPSQKQIFNGIFQYLKHLGSDLIEITASSLREGSPQNVIIYDDESKIFYSQNYENSWLTFHFKKHKIIPLAYTIKRTDKYVHPVNWIIEGSNDNKNWKKINQQNNCKALDENKPFTFNIDTRESFRFIKMTMIGKNSSGITYSLIIESFEIFGIIISI